MNWMRDWVYLVIKPFLTQLKNRLGNIRIEGGKFYNAENQAIWDIPTEAEIEDAATNAVLAGNTTLNPNPYMTRGTLDYTEWLSKGARTALVTDKVPNAAGALMMKDGTYTIIGDTFCPMPKAMSYRASIDVMFEKDGQAEAGSNVTFYIGTVSYDSDDAAIYPQSITFVNKDGAPTDAAEPNTMELTRDLTGTYLYFTFQNGSIDSVKYVDKPHFRVCKFHSKQPNGEYSYVGINGRVYDHLGMSQDLKYNAWKVQDSSKGELDPLRYIVPTGEVVDGKDEYRLELTSSLEPKTAGKQYKAGDVWIQSYGGGTYSYWISGKAVPIDGKWHHYDSTWFNAENLDGRNTYYAYRNGTASVKLMVLPNYYYNDGVNGNVRISGVQKIKGYYGNIALLKRNN